MKLLKRISLISLIILGFQTYLYSDTPHYLDFKYVLNQSEAGKKAQSFLKNKLNNGIKKLKKKKKLFEEEEKNYFAKK